MCTDARPHELFGVTRKKGPARFGHGVKGGRSARTCVTFCSRKLFRNETPHTINILI